MRCQQIFILFLFSFVFFSIHFSNIFCTFTTWFLSSILPVHPAMQAAAQSLHPPASACQKMHLSVFYGLFLLHRQKAEFLPFYHFHSFMVSCWPMLICDKKVFLVRNCYALPLSYWGKLSIGPIGDYPPILLFMVLITFPIHYLSYRLILFN